MNVGDSGYFKSGDSVPHDLGLAYQGCRFVITRIMDDNMVWIRIHPKSDKHYAQMHCVHKDVLYFYTEVKTNKPEPIKKITKFRFIH